MRHLLFFRGVPDFLGVFRAFSGVFLVFLGVFLVFLGCSGFSWECSWFSWGCSGVFGGVPGFLVVAECSVMFRCSAVPCSAVPVFLEVLHAVNVHHFSLKRSKLTESIESGG